METNPSLARSDLEVRDSYEELSSRKSSLISGAPKSAPQPRLGGPSTATTSEHVGTWRALLLSHCYRPQELRKIYSVCVCCFGAARGWPGRSSSRRISAPGLGCHDKHRRRSSGAAGATAGLQCHIFALGSGAFGVGQE